MPKILDRLVGQLTSKGMARDKALEELAGIPFEDTPMGPPPERSLRALAG